MLPRANDFSLATDNAYSTSEILAFELHILRVNKY